MIAVISIVSLMGVTLVPFLREGSTLGRYYKYIYALLIALGVSSLFCDAILHFIPHVSKVVRELYVVKLWNIHVAIQRCVVSVAKGQGVYSVYHLLRFLVSICVCVCVCVCACTSVTHLTSPNHKKKCCVIDLFVLGNGM